MKTLLTIAQQNEFLANNSNLRVLTHKWSCRGYGNSKILDQRDDVLSKASGCGYDRYGTVIGHFITDTFQDELKKLAKRFCKTKQGFRKGSDQFYGLYLSQEGKAYLDGACGYNCMYKVLNCIGFELGEIGRTEKSNNGETFLQLIPVTKYNKKYNVTSVK